MTISEPPVTVSEQTQVIPAETVVESTPVILESSVIKGMNLLSGDQSFASEIGLQEIAMHSEEEPRAEGLLKSGSNETENCINTDLNINNHLIAQEIERSTVSAASTGAVGEIGEEAVLPTSETKQCAVLDTCPSVSETELGGTLSSVGPLVLESEAVLIVQMVKGGRRRLISRTKEWLLLFSC